MAGSSLNVDGHVGRPATLRPHALAACDWTDAGRAGEGKLCAADLQQEGLVVVGAVVEVCSRDKGGPVSQKFPQDSPRFLP